MTTTTSQKKLIAREAQETFARLAKAILAQVEIAANSKQSEADRADALHRLEAVGAALAHPK